MESDGCFYYGRRVTNYRGRCLVCGRWVHNDEHRSAHLHRGMKAIADTGSELPFLSLPADAVLA